jgi:flagellar assembly protein FliH
VPLIKNVRARELVQGAVVMNLGDVREEAAKILDDARVESARIIAEARAEAQRLTDGAEDRGHAEGLVRGESEGREAGLELGRAEGIAAAEAAMSERLAAIADGWTTALEQILQSRELLRDEARRDLLRLSLAITERVLGRLPAHDPTVVVDQVESAIAMLTGATRLRVRVHPDDLEMVERHFAGVVAGIRGASDLDVGFDTDDSIIRGGCVVSAGDGEIDARLYHQISRIVHGVFPELLESPVAPEAAPAPMPASTRATDHAEASVGGDASVSDDIEAPESIEDIARDLAELGFDDLDALDGGDDAADPDADGDAEGDRGLGESS